ncbi:hypothetical protein FJV41_40875 [Myxococcus llanfairpwllgwyngyllgogerychwyrndrobwllllantysiliogogogochensis]|uniref:Uncharacterized protein n=1 Tax=Myxococcus llanfairpwllgwyngyllgogerychwyrndrobwllllantysiliogogogochensis TaxID=2590453 RepID=A0A540WMB9_9BACT|nr:hypothetical protein FJV41_40875 [Myxococcus llanfairpwllgwyngyllgogerychwyrndrobwllllantysiliogogogochensis]
MGCGSATVGAVGPPASAKWEGPPVTTPDGGTVRYAIYYGPWLCSARWMTQCERRCAAEGHVLLGCIWLADLKGDWSGRWAYLPAQAGTRYALTHCCCDYAVTDPTRTRRQWDNARDNYRRDWIAEFGGWPQSGGRNWPGHHIRDLGHGGHPTDPRNVFPIPDAVHTVVNSAYPQCYARGSRWSTIGPDRPYSD